MSRYRKIPVEIEAQEWTPNTPHPAVTPYRGGDTLEMTRLCEACGFSMVHHGAIETLEGGHFVCPGDFIITGVENEKYPCKPHVFHKTYEALDA